MIWTGSDKTDFDIDKNDNFNFGSTPGRSRL